MKHQGHNLAGGKVLLVDDTIANIDILVKTLEPEGYNLAIATSGKQALKVAENFNPDLILLDIMMPEMDGYEAIRRIRKLPGKLKNLPIIALTAKAMKGDREKCIRTGASDYIAKPVDTEQLLSLLRVWLYK